MYPKILAILLIVFLAGCSSQPVNQELTRVESNVVNAEILSDAEGSELLKMHCFACHNPQAQDHDNMLAPPLAAVKFRYKQLYNSREQFIAHMSEFLINPSEEKAILKGPVKRFGLMPKPTITSSEEINKLVAFIYDNPVEYPDWFPKHFEEQHGEAWSNQ